MRVALLAPLVLVACSTPRAGEPVPEVALGDAGLFARPAAEWVELEPGSNSRVAEYSVPGPGGEASLVVFHFAGSGGTVEANFQRWTEQFVDGSGAAPAPELAERREVSGLAVHELQVGGRYVAAVTPGSEERFDEPGWRLHAAVVETPDGPYYPKLVGPEATVRASAAAWRAFLDSLRFEAPAAAEPRTDQ